MVRRLEPSEFIARRGGAGPSTGLELIEALDVDRYHLFHAVRADLLRRLGRTEEAVAAYAAAIARTENDVERAHLARRCGELTGAR